MIFKLSKNISAGQKIKTRYGWRKVKSVNDIGAVIKEGTIIFGDIIYGFKSK